MAFQSDCCMWGASFLATNVPQIAWLRHLKWLQPGGLLLCLNDAKKRQKTKKQNLATVPKNHYIMIVQQLKEKRHQTGGYHAPPFGIAHEIGAMCSMHPTDSGIQQVALQGFETLIKRVLLLSLKYLLPFQLWEFTDLLEVNPFRKSPMSCWFMALHYCHCAIVQSVLQPWIGRVCTQLSGSSSLLLFISRTLEWAQLKTSWYKTGSVKSGWIIFFFQNQTCTPCHPIFAIFKKKGIHTWPKSFST